MVPARVRVAVIDDYEVIVRGVAAILGPSPGIEVVEIATDESPASDVDVSLYDSFAQGEAHTHDLDELLANARAGRVVMYTWNFDPRLVRRARTRGLSGYLSKGLPAGALAGAIERIHHGEFVVDASGSHLGAKSGRAYPGADVGLTEREAEVVALIAKGHDNAAISHLLFLSPDGTKSRIRSAYRKIGVADRSGAIRWGLTHGFLPQ